MQCASGSASSGEAKQPSLEKAESSALAAWTAQRDGILSKIKQRAGRQPNDRTLGIEELRTQLEGLDAAKPKLPVLARLFYEDATPEAMGRDIAEGWPSGSWWSDEAGVVIGSHAMSESSLMRTLALCNRTSGTDSLTSLTVRRSPASRSLAAVSPLSLMMQPGIQQNVGTGDGLAQRSRIHCAIPDLVAQSPRWEAGSTTRTSNQRLGAVHLRLGELLDLPLPTVGPTLRA